jgi:diaminopimelate decarboxylase
MTRLLVSDGPDHAGRAVGRALKNGLPSVPVTAVSPAPHAPCADAFEDVWEPPSAFSADPSAYADAIGDRLHAHDGAFLPTRPAEVHWLSARHPSLASLLAPPPGALSKTTGPAPEAADNLPVSLPPWQPLSAPIETLHAFGRRHGWSLWMRGPLDQRRALGHWSEFDGARDALLDRTGANGAIYLQRRVEGTRCAIAFAASQGDVLAASLLQPVDDQGLAYAPAPVPAGLQSALRDTLRALGWTGGGRLDLVVDADGTRWLDTWRPCFGNEVDGLARCGTNLPAQLIAAQTGEAAASPAAPASSFRIPARLQEPAPKGSPPSPLLPTSTRPNLSGPNPGLTKDLRALVNELPPKGATDDTPRSLLLPRRTRTRFEAFAEAASRLETEFDLGTARVGLSIKTNPSDRLLATARDTGLLAETIHPDEMEHARSHGYSTDEIIVNGPVQALLPRLDTAPYAVFGDAITDLADLPFDPSGAIVGVRTRPPERGPSRFGTDLSDPARMARLCEHFSALPADARLGLHLHAPASTLGHDRWWASLKRVLSWARTIQDRTGRPVECLDLGGGWHPDDWLDVFVPGLLRRRPSILDALPALDTLLLEPGKALSQPLGVVVSRVLDARPSRSEVILDASLAELSNIDYHPHRLLAHTDERGWHRLPRGAGRLLGRLCMEADILGRRRQVDHLSPGDTVVVCDAGAYDASMTYPFGRGHTASS